MKLKEAVGNHSLLIPKRNSRKENGMKEITIGIAGAGRAFRLHADALKYVHGVSVRKKTVMDTNTAQAEAMKYQTHSGRLPPSLSPTRKWIVSTAQECSVGQEDLPRILIQQALMK